MNAGKFEAVKIPHRRRLKRCLGITSDEAVEDLCRLPPVVAEDPACNVGVKGVRRPWATSAEMSCSLRERQEADAEAFPSKELTLHTGKGPCL